MKKLVLLAVLGASLGLPATAASASCTPTPIEGGPSCMEQAACKAVSAIDKYLPSDCIQ